MSGVDLVDFEQSRKRWCCCCKDCPLSSYRLIIWIWVIVFGLLLIAGIITLVDKSVNHVTIDAFIWISILVVGVLFILMIILLIWHYRQYQDHDYRSIGRLP